MQNSYCDHGNFDILASLNLSMKRNTEENSPLGLQQQTGKHFHLRFALFLMPGGGGGAGASDPADLTLSLCMGSIRDPELKDSCKRSVNALPKVVCFLRVLWFPVTGNVDNVD